jgi:hypothetical protein
MSKNDTLLDQAWEKVEEKCRFIEQVQLHGKYDISADDIKLYGNREPRLMTKFDSSDQLPTLFAKNSLSILPITRGKYLISQDQMFKKITITNGPCPQVMKIPDYIRSINPNKIANETIALNCAYLSGMTADFLEDHNLLPTIEGRMSSQRFKFKIKNTKNASGEDWVAVNKSQIEIDGAYEGEKYFSIFEAKKLVCKDFLIRQLYYPFRACENLVTKPIKLVFFIYSNGLYHFYEYRYPDSIYYNGLVLEKQKTYLLEEQYKITLDDIKKILYTAKQVPEPDVPFPQADDFNKVINLLEIGNPSITKERVMENFGVVKRQADYYPNACIYLGLMKKNKVSNDDITFSLTERGKSILNSSFSQRQLALTRCILEHPVFNQAFSVALNQNGSIDSKQAEQLIRDNKIPISKSTPHRRASTVKKWIKWIFNLFDQDNT